MTIVVSGKRSIVEFMKLAREARKKQGTPLQDELRTVIAKAKKTGNRITIRLRKDELKEEDLFDDLMADPRTKFLTKDTLIIDIAPLTEISVDELCDLCLKAGIENKLAMTLVKSLQFQGRPFDGMQSVNILTQSINELKAAGKQAGHTGPTVSTPAFKPVENKEEGTKN